MPVRYFPATEMTPTFSLMLFKKSFASSETLNFSMRKLEGSYFTLYLVVINKVDGLESFLVLDLGGIRLLRGWAHIRDAAVLI